MDFRIKRRHAGANQHVSGLSLYRFTRHTHSPATTVFRRLR